MSRLPAVSLVFVCSLLVCPPRAAAQADDGRIRLGAHFAAARSSQFDKTDLGIGALLSWGGGLFGADAEVTFYPSDLADDPAFSASRVEGLFGVTFGPRIGSIRPFVKVRPGFVRFAEAPEPFACILIFPPPLACALADGHTSFALDLGGGLELTTTPRTFVRVDVGDRAVRYPGPVIETDGGVQDDSFFSHDFRFQIGGGVRF